MESRGYSPWRQQELLPRHQLRAVVLIPDWASASPVEFKENSRTNRQTNKSKTHKGND